MDEQNKEKRVSLIEDRVIYVRELDTPTPETVSQSARDVRELSREWDEFSIIVEFPSLVFPSSHVRHRVAEEMVPIRGKLVHVAVVTNTNVMLSVAMKFIGALSGFDNISIYPTREAAIDAVSKQRKAAALNIEK